MIKLIKQKFGITIVFVFLFYSFSHPAVVSSRTGDIITTHVVELSSSKAQTSISFQEAPLAGSLLSSFLASSATNYPPDTMGAVGPNHLMVTIRGKVCIQDKTGKILVSMTLDQFWSPVTPGGLTVDPKTFYDPDIGRFITVGFCSSNTPNSTVLFGVSSSSDPTKTWYLRGLKGDNNGSAWADYPNVGFNQKWIAIAAEMYGVPKQLFLGNKLWVIPKSSAIQAGSITPYIFPTGFSTTGNALYPCPSYDADTDLYILDNRYGADTNRQVRVSIVTGPVDSPQWKVKGFANVQSYSRLNPKAPQPGTSVLIPVIDSRIVNGLQRNGSLWYTHHAGYPPLTPNRSVVLWHQVSTNLSVIQQGRIDGAVSSNSTFYFYPSIAVNSQNDVGLGFNGSDKVSNYGSGFYTFRKSTDPLGTMQPIQLLKAGIAVYNNARWGDYSATEVDPTNDTFWTMQQYAIPGSKYNIWWGNFSAATSIATGNPPAAGFYGTPTSGTGPITINFIDTSANSPTAWNWNFGDGISSNNQNPSHSYGGVSVTTSYNVRLIASNSFGSGTSQKNGYITIFSSPPVAPSNLVASAISSTLIFLSWRDNSANESGFLVYRDGQSITQLGINSTSYLDSNLSPSSTYCYQVAAFNSMGTTFSNSSCARTFDINTSPVFFSDDFSSGSLSQWTAIDEGNQFEPSHWIINSGALREDSNIFDGDQTRNNLPKLGTYLIPTADGAGWLDYEFNCQLKSTDDDALGVIFRYQDNNNYYRFSMDSQRFYRRLTKKFNGQWYLLAEDSTRYRGNQWMDIKIGVVGPSIKVLVDNAIVFSIMDNSIPNGKIGLYSWGEQAAFFDNIYVVPTTHPLFSEDFDAGTLSQWTTMDEGTISAPSKWRVTNKQLIEDSNIYDGDLNRDTLPKLGTNLIPLVDGSAWTDYDFNCQVKSTDDDAIGVLFRYQDNDNYYRFSMDNQRFYRRITRKLNGQWLLLAEDSTAYTRNTFLNLRVNVVGDTFTVYLNDSMILTAQDSAIPAGSIGLYSWGEQAVYFDNINLMSLSNPIMTFLVRQTQPECPEFEAMMANGESEEADEDKD